MTAAIAGLKKLVIPDSQALVTGGATPEMMALLNDLNKRIELIAAAQQPEQEPSVVRQIRSTADGTGFTTSAVIPDDNTTPQIGEGTECQSLAFTPLAADTKLEIEWTGLVGVTASSVAISALFVSGTNDALVTRYFNNPLAAGVMTTSVTLRVTMDSWGTTAKTFSARFGVGNGASTASVARSTGSTLLNNTVLSVLTIKEYKNPA